MRIAIDNAVIHHLSDVKLDFKVADPAELPIPKSFLRCKLRTCVYCMQIALIRFAVMAIPLDRIHSGTNLFNNYEWIVVQCSGDIRGAAVYGRPCPADGWRTPSHCLEIEVNDLKELQKLAKLAAKFNMSLLGSNVTPNVKKPQAKSRHGK